MNKDRLRTHGPLIIAFIIIQILGLFIMAHYAPSEQLLVSENSTKIVKEYNLPFGLNPPSEVQYEYTLIQLVLSIAFVIFIILLLMKLHVVRVLRIWFFLVSIIAIAVTVTAFTGISSIGSALAIIMGVIIAYFKVFQPHIITHNIAELLVYPGIAAVLAPLFNITTIIMLFVIISLYDMYAVWHSGFMQRMAKYQIKHVRVFSGLLLPQFVTKSGIVNPFSKKYKKGKKIGVALLGGGDIIFPMLLAGVLMHAGFLGAAIASIIGATIGLTLLITNSRKGKFYPAMPFITLGCFAGILLLMPF